MAADTRTKGVVMHTDLTVECLVGYEWLDEVGSLPTKRINCLKRFIRRIKRLFGML